MLLPDILTFVCVKSVDARTGAGDAWVVACRDDAASGRFFDRFGSTVRSRRLCRSETHFVLSDRKHD